MNTTEKTAGNKTKRDSTSLAFAMAGKVQDGLAAARLEPTQMKFWVDNAVATNESCRWFAELPLVVQCMTMSNDIMNEALILSGALDRFGYLYRIYCLPVVDSVVLDQRAEVIVTDNVKWMDSINAQKEKGRDLQILLIAGPQVTTCLPFNAEKFPDWEDVLLRLVQFAHNRASRKFDEQREAFKRTLPSGV